MDLTFESAVERAGQAMDIAGVVIIVAGALYATVLYARRWRD